MKNVLIALDYDPTAQKVAEVGYSIANAMGASVTLLHIISGPDHYNEMKHITIMGFSDPEECKPLPADNIEKLKNISQLFLDNTKQHLGDTTITTMVEGGDYGDSIVRTADDILADVIVMGSHSRKWLHNLVIGGVTERVLHYTSVPVLVVPTQYEKY